MANVQDMINVRLRKNYACGVDGKVWGQHLTGMWGTDTENGNETNSC